MYFEFQTSLEADFECNQCGCHLDVTWSDTYTAFYIEPCEDCMDDKEKEGFRDGHEQGYDEGLQDGLDKSDG